MDFYRALSPFYDEIFPASTEAISFLDSQCKTRVDGELRILDAACGTGGHVLGLSSLGYDVTGIDIDASMINLAQEKEYAKEIDFIEGDMRSLGEHSFPDKFDLIYCIGNSLVHLNEVREIEIFLNKVKKLLRPSGRGVVQILNYDRIREKRITELPQIDAAGGEVTFFRRYVFESADSLLFEGELRVKGAALSRIMDMDQTGDTLDGGSGDRVFVNQIRLLPLSGKNASFSV